MASKISSFLKYEIISGIFLIVVITTAKFFSPFQVFILRNGLSINFSSFLFKKNRFSNMINNLVLITFSAKHPPKGKKKCSFLEGYACPDFLSYT